jgi:hypothetical protein
VFIFHRRPKSNANYFSKPKLRFMGASVQGVFSGLMPIGLSLRTGR